MWIIKQSARLLSKPLPSNECATKSQLPVFWLCSAEPLGPQTTRLGPKRVEMNALAKTESRRVLKPASSNELFGCDAMNSFSVIAQPSNLFERSGALRFSRGGRLSFIIRAQGKCARRGKFIMEEGWFSYRPTTHSTEWRKTLRGWPASC